MKKKLLLLAIPPMLAGCAQLQKKPPSSTPALVFVDSVSLKDAEIIARARVGLTAKPGKLPTPPPAAATIKPTSAPVATAKTEPPKVAPATVPPASSKPATTPPAKPTNPFKAPVPRWTAERGENIRDAVTRWASTASCETQYGKFWSVVWGDDVANYRLDAPLRFTGTFEQMLGEVFTLYQRAETPLLASASRHQCVIVVSDQKAR